ncbi:uncharacterized protein LOC113337642, partial [Papaver somniferum]|uniref:uncharacterized protein LOC113337642 n=1 Tax=Papaver somniferum TaxID=3469 RepID=UPI000E705727
MIEALVNDPSTSNQSYSKKLSFADTVKKRVTLNPTSVDISKLPNPTLVDGEPSLEIPNDFFQEGCKPFPNSFIARLDATGLKFNDVKKNLKDQWKLGVNRCKFVPMSKGFFVIMLSSSDDKEKIRASNWFVNHHALKLIDWYSGFNSEKPKTSHVAVWVRFPGLPMELWTENSLLSMGNTFGTPIVVDQKNPKSRLWTLCFCGRNFWQYQDIPNTPKFCFACNIIGHIDDECKKKNNASSSREKAKQFEGVPLANKKKGNNQQWQVKQKKDDDAIASKEDIVARNNSVNAGHAVTTVQSGNQSVGVLAKDKNAPPEVGTNNEQHQTSVDEDNRLETELAKSAAEFREAQMKFIQCKNAIAAKEALAVRKNQEPKYAHADHAVITQ